MLSRANSPVYVFLYVFKEEGFSSLILMRQRHLPFSPHQLEVKTVFAKLKMIMREEVEFRFLFAHYNTYHSCVRGFISV